MSFFNHLYLNHPSTYNYNYKYKLFLDAFFIGFFESANADTWASELGILSRQSPILILKGFQHVPKGINGAISKYGTICSIFGGLFISIIAIICNIVRYGIKNYFINFNIPLLSIGIKLLLCGGFIGFIGSLIDSILGQTIQLTIYNVTKQCVIEKEQVENAIKNGDKLKYYGKDILNNSGINLVTGLITALISGYLGVILF
ncbi:hypothetical protein BCR32DRAFT_325256 [Anaeromyces robustus]|uniref:DUF92-domain-containing protein n=1 Tax=Anaeromyces robustus TaxID=1754192 RepID=A0A1Y1XKJ1_9FUNG|nr:hypothetical protein BCR32DRAFT_325256 [Anaeromyces robustus]|eukprot:ORX85864.1 hypothetical protein BCR32DRAFT_325256 [Anaeromyces robustus]